MKSSTKVLAQIASTLTTSLLLLSCRTTPAPLQPELTPTSTTIPMPISSPSPTALPTPSVLLDSDPPPVPSDSGSLPEGAKARLGTSMWGGISLTPDGSLLIIVSSVGLQAYRATDFSRLWSYVVPQGDQASLSTDASLLATTNEKEITLYHTGSFESVWSVPQEPAQSQAPGYDDPNTVAFAPNGRLLASTSAGEKILEWKYLSTFSCHITLRQVDTGEPVHLLKDTGCQLVWSPDGTMLAAYWEGGLDIWNVATGEMLQSNQDEFLGWSLQGHLYGVTRSAFPDPAQHLIIDGSSGKTLFDLGSDEDFLMWSLTGNRIASRHPYDGADKIFDVHSGTLIDSVAVSENTLVAWSSDDRLVELSVTTDGILGLTDTQSGEILTPPFPSLRAESRNGAWILTSPDSKTLYTNVYSSFLGNAHHALVAWDMQTGRPLQRIQWVGSITDLSFSPDGTLLAVGDQQGAIILWNVMTGKAIRQLRGDNKLPDSMISIAWSPNGQWLAATGYSPSLADSAETRLWVWDVLTGHVIYEHPQGEDNLGGIAWSPDSTRLAVAAGVEGQAWLMDTSTWEQVDSIASAEYNQVTDVAWSPDGQHLAIVFVYGPLKIADVATGSTVLSATGGASRRNSLSNILSWSPDGTQLAALGYTSVEVWNVQKQSYHDFVFSDEPGDLMRTVVWAPAAVKGYIGRAPIATICGSQLVIWDPATDKILLNIPHGHAGGVDALAWSPDGKLLASGSWDGTVILWDVEKLLNHQ